MKRIATTLALAAVVSVAAATTHAATPETGVARLTVAQKHAIKAAGEWHRGCPVWLSELRVLSYRYYGFDKDTHIGQIVVNRKVAHPLAKVFAKLYRMRFPIRDGAFSSVVRPAPVEERRRHRLLRVPQRRRLAVQQQHDHASLVESRVRRGGRPRPAREPVRRLRDDA